MRKTKKSSQSASLMEDFLNFMCSIGKKKCVNTIIPLGSHLMTSSSPQPKQSYS